MRETSVRNWLLVLVAAIIIVTAVFLLRGPVIPRSMADLTEDFIACLPSDVSQQQRNEIRGIITRFDQRYEQGKVTPKDRRVIRDKLEVVVEAGTIDWTELNRLMAEISFYTRRLDPEYNPDDGSGVHPLLKDEQADTTS